MGESFLEGAVPGRPGPQRAPFPISRSKFAGALLLGQLRPRLLEVLGPSGDAATGRWDHRAPGRRCRAGVLWVLAGPLALSASGFLLVHVSEAGGNRAAVDPARGRFVEPGARRVCASLRGRPKERVASRGDAAVFREHVRRRRSPGKVGAGPFGRTRPLSSATAINRRLHITVKPPRDPGYSALRRATRAAIVIPLAFAFADLLLRAPQSLVFVMFGCFSLLVISDFGGFRRPRALAYLASTLVGGALVALGTLVSTSTWLPAVVMFVVAFAVTFSRIFGGYVAAANLGMLLAFVIAVTIPAPPDAIPARVGGWAMAGLVSTAAAVALWPRFERVMTNKLASKALLAVADLVQGIRADEADFLRLEEGARVAVQEARQAYAVMGKRPIAPAPRDRAFIQMLIE